MTVPDIFISVILLGSVALFGLAAVLVFSWAFRTGQLSNFEQAAQSIFDADEPIGQPTDRFPTANQALADNPRK
ncbi:MAG: hypothetical protein N2112_07995 [Gemmataceae bacterium]|jgi:cbb3-type cytochrome oxidase subunit 3|nr:hypothetical protein [Gemmataceae bacterium]